MQVPRMLLNLDHEAGCAAKASSRRARLGPLAALIFAACLASPAAAIDLDLVPIARDAFTMGDAAGDANEAPHRVTVMPFRLMRNEVTNRLFAAFVAATGHRTDAERGGSGYVWDGRWRQAAANWRRPDGALSIDGLDDHPVVQVSARDASAFCRWQGLRLPTEEEWEFAARGPRSLRYPWGDERPTNATVRRANFGTIPCCAPDASDDFARTAPIGRYPRGASPFCLLDMAGNVWEWTASRFADNPGFVVLKGGGWGNNPYCLRAAYRHGNPPDIGLDMVGFRCAGDALP